MASIDGNFVFGYELTSVSRARPRSVQREAFFGVNGMLNSDGGSRGGDMAIRGKIVGETPAILALNLSYISAYQDGRTHIVVDTLGRSYYAVMDGYDEDPGYTFNAASGLYQKYYTASFWLRF